MQGCRNVKHFRHHQCPDGLESHRLHQCCRTGKDDHQRPIRNDYLSVLWLHDELRPYRFDSSGKRLLGKGGSRWTIDPCVDEFPNVLCKEYDENRSYGRDATTATIVRSTDQGSPIINPSKLQATAELSQSV